VKKTNPDNGMMATSKMTLKTSSNSSQVSKV